MLEDQLEEMIKQLDSILDENVDVSDEEWYKDLEVSLEKLKDSLSRLQNENKI